MNNNSDDFLEYLFVTGQLDDSPFANIAEEIEEELEDEEKLLKKLIKSRREYEK